MRATTGERAVASAGVQGAASRPASSASSARCTSAGGGRAADAGRACLAPSSTPSTIRPANTRRGCPRQGKRCTLAAGCGCLGALRQASHNARRRALARTHARGRALHSVRRRSTCVEPPPDGARSGRPCAGSALQPPRRAHADTHASTLFAAARAGAAAGRSRTAHRARGRAPGRAGSGPCSAPRRRAAPAAAAPRPGAVAGASAACAAWRPAAAGVGLEP